MIQAPEATFKSDSKILDKGRSVSYKRTSLFCCGEEHHSKKSFSLEAT
jgi:hypothetical protein